MPGGRKEVMHENASADPFAGIIRFRFCGFDLSRFRLPEQHPVVYGA